MTVGSLLEIRVISKPMCLTQLGPPFSTGSFCCLGAKEYMHHSPIMGLSKLVPGDLAVGQNQLYHFGVGAPPILVYFSGDWDVHRVPIAISLSTVRWRDSLRILDHG